MCFHVLVEPSYSLFCFVSNVLVGLAVCYSSDIHVCVLHVNIYIYIYCSVIEPQLSQVYNSLPPPSFLLCNYLIGHNHVFQRFSHCNIFSSDHRNYANYLESSASNHFPFARIGHHVFQALGYTSQYVKANSSNRFYFLPAGSLAFSHTNAA